MRSLFSNMNEEQKNLAKGAKSKEELKGLLKSDKMKLSEDQLQKVSGGGRGIGSDAPGCPHSTENIWSCINCKYRTIEVNGRPERCPAYTAYTFGDAREGVDPNKVSKGLAEGRLTGAAFFA